MDIVGWSDPLKDLIQGSQEKQDKGTPRESISTEANSEELKPTVVPVPMKD
jgi:hypothetical protein